MISHSRVRTVWTRLWLAAIEKLRELSDMRSPKLQVTLGYIERCDLVEECKYPPQLEIKRVYL